MAAFAKTSSEVLLDVPDPSTNTGGAPGIGEFSTDVQQGEINSGEGRSSDMHNKLTAECPPPPFYYKQFADSHTCINGKEIEPPVLTSVDVSSLENTEGLEHLDGETLQRLALQKCVYGGTVNHLRKLYTYNAQTDYKLNLKQAVNKILTVSLEMASDVPPQQAPEVASLRLAEALQHIHTLLGEYRTHEARENLIALRNKEIEHLLKLAEQMESLAAMDSSQVQP